MTSACGLMRMGRVQMGHWATAATGITTADVTRPGLPSMRDVGPRLLAWVAERAADATPVLAAHNGRRFDVPMLQANLARVGAQLPPDWWFLDTYLLAKDSRGPEEVLKQEALSIKYGVANMHDGSLGRHRALGDVRELARLLPHLQARARAARTAQMLLVRDAAGRIGDIAAQKAAPAITRAARRAEREAEQLRDVMQHSVGFQAAQDPLSQVEAEVLVPARRAQDVRAPVTPTAPAAPAAAAALAAGACAHRAAQRARAQAHAAADNAAFLSLGEDAAGEAGVPLAEAHGGDWAALAARGGGAATLLDVPLAELGRRAFTARQCAMLREAGVDTLGDLLRVFPRDHISYARRLAPGRHVQLAGTVTRVRAAIVRRGRPMGFFELDAAVDAAAPGGLGGGALGDEEEEEEDADDALGYWDPVDEAGDVDAAAIREAGAAGQAADDALGQAGGEGEGEGCDEADAVAGPASGEAEADGLSAQELALVPPEALQGMQTVRLKKVMVAYMATNVLSLKAAHPLGSPVVLRGRLLWKPGAHHRPSARLFACALQTLRPARVVVATDTLCQGRVPGWQPRRAHGCLLWQPGVGASLVPGQCTAATGPCTCAGIQAVLSWVRRWACLDGQAVLWALIVGGGASSRRWM